MERHRAKADHHVANIGQEKDGRVVILEDISDSLDTKPHKHQVGQCVDQLGTVICDVIVLCKIMMSLLGQNGM